MLRQHLYKNKEETEVAKAFCWLFPSLKVYICMLEGSPLYVHTHKDKHSTLSEVNKYTVFVICYIIFIMNTVSHFVLERYPFKEDVLFHPGKWTTMEKGIQYLRQLAVLEVVYRPLLT